jgi:ABC-type transporter MlaC component
MGERLSVENIVFTREKNRALISVEVDRSPKEAQGYNMVLEQSSGTWKIVGVWATWAT